MSTINWLSFRNFDSRDHNVYVRKKNVFDVSGKDLQFVTVPGRDGDIIINQSGSKNLTIKYGLSIFSSQFSEISENENFFYAMQDMKRKLVEDGGYYNLYDSYTPNYYRKACLTKGLSIEQPHWSVGKFDLEFSCKPYLYRIDGDTTQMITTKNTSIYNSEIYDSLPYIKITGSGDLSLVINGSYYDFTNVSGYVECDSEMMNVYKGTVNKNSDFLTSGFPKLSSGNNVISWTGTVTQIEIKPRWRTK